MPEFPKSLDEFERLFPDEESCARWLYRARWPEGFRCPDCGCDRGYELTKRTLVIACAGCAKQTSVTAGTTLHQTHLPLRTWFRAAWLVATHKNGISAMQLRIQLGLGSYKTAWSLLKRLRGAMVDPDRSPLAGLVEVDEASLPYRTKNDPVSGGCGRSSEGKMLIAAATEAREKGPGRIRLAVIEDYSAQSLRGFLAGACAPGATVLSDGWSGYIGLERAVGGLRHDVKIVGAMAAHVVLPWVHRLIANLKRWALGVYHGLRRRCLQSYLDEFVFRFNRRRNPQAAFAKLLGVAVRRPPLHHKM